MCWKLQFLPCASLNHFGNYEFIMILLVKYDSNLNVLFVCYFKLYVMSKDELINAWCDRDKMNIARDKNRSIIRLQF